ncbi:MAG TPA: helix-turn-helix transcriptional regulator [Verrucomicrobiae bacterium]|nr:helix-turn-helix transcriptional regulator [Verrucomicrobiae bacterium]
MNEKERRAQIAIGKRLREFRELLRIPRTSFAVEIGIGNERLATYEAGRVALPWGVFASITKRFNLNPVWLAIGEYSERLEEPFDDSIYENIDSRKRFAEVFDEISPQLVTPVSGLVEIMGKINRIGNLIGEVRADVVKFKVRSNALPSLEPFYDNWKEIAASAEAELKHWRRKRADMLSGFVIDKSHGQNEQSDKPKRPRR